ncbi:XRE family transcriptional regulator [Cupriavidus gilardii]|nr:XRE family transcriptional regulator [Cupriavidus gilardii]
MSYSPPSPAQLAALKQELGMSSAQMADLFGVSDGRQWRKYSGGEREISMQMLFFGIARLELDEQTIARLFNRMRALGASLSEETKS